MVSIAVFSFLFRGYLVVVDLVDGDQTAFLAFPLSVVLPIIVFSFLATRRDMSSQEGALMQLGAMIQILLIVALPQFAIYLALGFPIVFLLVELFETRGPTRLKSEVKSRLLA
jgi:ABC-type amino acid transport system permease subunit